MYEHIHVTRMHSLHLHLNCTAFSNPSVDNAASFASSAQIENKWSSIRSKCLNETHYLAYGVYENSIKGNLE